MKSLYEQFGGTYCKQSNYFIPNLTLPESEENNIGIYGHEVFNEYLSEIDKQARERLCRIVKQLKTTQGTTEQLKSDNPIKWVEQMNCIRQQAEEIVLKENHLRIGRQRRHGVISAAFLGKYL